MNETYLFIFITYWISFCSSNKTFFCFCSCRSFLSFFLFLHIPLKNFHHLASTSPSLMYKICLVCKSISIQFEWSDARMSMRGMCEHPNMPPLIYVYGLHHHSLRYWHFTNIFIETQKKSIQHTTPHHTAPSQQIAFCDMEHQPKYVEYTIFNVPIYIRDDIHCVCTCTRAQAL